MQYSEDEVRLIISGCEAEKAAAVKAERERCYDIVMREPFLQELPTDEDMDEWEKPRQAVEIALKAMAFDITTKIRQGGDGPGKG